MSILDSISEHVHNQVTAQDVNKNIATGIKGKDRDEIPSENKEQGHDSIDQAMHNEQTRNDTLQDRGSQAVESREGIQHEIGEISNLIIRDGSKFSNTQTGNLVYKDDSSAIVQIGKNIGLSYDAQNFKNIELGERVTISMVHDEHRIMAAAEFDRQQQGHDVSGADRAVELDNEMH